MNGSEKQRIQWQFTAEITLIFENKKTGSSFPHANTSDSTEKEILNIQDRKKWQVVVHLTESIDIMGEQEE